jgi:hypothetical protein
MFRKAGKAQKDHLPENTTSVWKTNLNLIFVGPDGSDFVEHEKKCRAPLRALS